MQKAIFITGGGSGIGQATAKLFAAKGWRVGLADIDATGLADTAAMLPPGLAETYMMDVRDRAAWVASLDAFVASTGGRLDILFNNAGIGIGGPLAEMRFEDLDRVIGVNLVGMLNGAKIGYAYLAKTPGSCLLNTASAAAIYGSPGLPVYSAAKFGVRALTEALDGEWHPAGIKVRALIPGFIDTPLLAHAAGNGNRSIRQAVTAAGLELTGVEAVARAAWDAAHGDRVHTYVGKTAGRMAFAARWMPGRLRRRMRRIRMRD